MRARSLGLRDPGELCSIRRYPRELGFHMRTRILPWPLRQDSRRLGRTHTADFPPTTRTGDSRRPALSPRPLPTSGPEKKGIGRCCPGSPALENRGPATTFCWGEPRSMTAAVNSSPLRKNRGSDD